MMVNMNYKTPLRIESRRGILFCPLLLGSLIQLQRQNARPCFLLLSVPLSLASPSPLSLRAKPSLVGRSMAKVVAARTCVTLKREKQ